MTILPKPQKIKERKKSDLLSTLGLYSTIRAKDFNRTSLGLVKLSMKTSVKGEGQEVVLNIKWKKVILKILHFPKTFWITLI